MNGNEITRITIV